MCPRESGVNRVDLGRDKGLGMGGPEGSTLISNSDLFLNWDLTFEYLV